MNKTIKTTVTTLFLLVALTANLSAAKKKADSEVEENESKKNYMGWIDTSNKDVSVRMGNIRMNAKTRLGSFNISVIDENKKRIPVLYSGNEYTSTGFYLKVNNKVYRLIAESNIKTAARKTNTGMQINYSVKNVAEVFVDFRCLKSSPDSGYDMIKITTTVTNVGNKKADYAVKLILDTVLGESGSAHFYTCEDIPVKTEALYRTVQNNKWFSSKNNNAEMQILLSGSDITTPEVVALANYSTLERYTWEPEMLSYRTFDTVLAYNNSAVGIIWPGSKLGVNGRLTDTFYLGFGFDGQKAQGDLYVSDKSSSSIDVNEVVENYEKNTKQFLLDDTVITEVDNAKQETIYVEPKQLPKPVVIEQRRPGDIITKEQMSPAYIQKLIDRITELEEKPELASEEEINLLNAELDAILQALM